MNNDKQNNIELISALKETIVSTLRPLISKKCILLDAPYHQNVGDILIWAGEQALLEALEVKCIYTASYDTCRYPKIGTDVTILFHGGGNIGDIYHEHVEFLLNVIKHYPHNRIIICPQSVYYSDIDLERKDFHQIASHKDLYFCGRDNISAKLVENYLGSRVLCLPDSAFCIPLTKLEILKKHTLRDHLYIERTDCEKRKIDVDLNIEKRDWPVFETSFRRSTFIHKILSRLAKIKLPLIGSSIDRLWDNYTQKVFINAMIREGVEFISEYKHISTTRLHGCILAILLDKEITFIDNSYGKNSRFYDTWLTNLKSLTFDRPHADSE